MMRLHKKYLLSCLIVPALCCAGFAFALSEKPVQAAPSAKESAASAKGTEGAFEPRLKSAAQYLQARNYTRARELYKEVYLSSKKGPQAEEAMFGLSKAEYHLKHYYEALLNLQRFITLYRESEHLDEARLLLGYMSLSLQKYKDAQQYFEAVTGKLKDKAVIGEAAASMYLGELQKAGASLESLNKKVQETDPRALHVKAMLYWKSGMLKDSVKAISRVPDPALRELEIRVDKAMIFLDALKIKEAEMICRDIIKAPLSISEKIGAKKVLLRSYEFQDKTDDALKLALELAPNESGDSFRARIVSLFDKKGDIESALRHLSYMKDKAKRSAEISRRLKGLIDSKDPKAVEYLGRFASYIDSESPMLLDVSRFLIANGRKNEGLSLLRKAKGIAGGDAAIYLAELLINEGKDAEARKLLDTLKFDMRYLGKASYMVGSLMEKEGDYSGAIAYLTKTSKLAKDPRVFFMLGNLYWKTGDRANAQKYYVTAADMGDALASVKAGDGFYLSGNMKKAEYYYKKALGIGIKDAKSLQWASYQYGKLAKDREAVKKAISGGGEVAEAAGVIMGED